MTVDVRDQLRELGAVMGSEQLPLTAADIRSRRAVVSPLRMMAQPMPPTRRGWSAAVVAAAVVLLVVGGLALLNRPGTGGAPSDDEVPPPTTSPNPAESLALPVFSAESLTLGQQQPFSFVSSSGVEIEYLLYVPGTYEDSSTWPLVLFLHAYLGQNATIETLRDQNPQFWFDSEPEFPFVMVAPLGPRGLWSEYHEPMEELFAMLGESLSIDQEARFLTGPSAGSVGVWQWALARPGSFTGIAPIAGGPSMSVGAPVPEGICRMVGLPVWIAHSKADALPIDSHAAIVAELEACGSTSVRFTVYEDLGHDESIRTAYAGPHLYEWMLEQVP